MSSKSGIAKIFVIALASIITVASIIGAYVLVQTPSPSSTPSPTSPVVPTPTPTFNPVGNPTPTPILTPISGQSAINATGHALYELSGTEFVFSDGSKTYNVTMDETTRCINLKGTLLGGSQFISRIILITSLPITITGTVNGSTITAQTVLLPTDKDNIT